LDDALRLSPSFDENNLMNFYGIWGDEQSAMFAVGGYWTVIDSQGGLDGAMVYHFDGSVWTEHDVRDLSDTLYVSPFKLIDGADFTEVDGWIDGVWV
jgi:hypothetical protein